VGVFFLTTQLKWQSKFDFLIQPSDLNGLKKKSLARINKLATIDKDLILGRLGSLEDVYIDVLNRNLIKILNIGN